MGTGLAAALEIKGGVCHVASYSDLDDYERLLRQAGKFDGVVHLWSLDATPEEFDTSQEGGCRSVLHLTKGLTKLERANPPRLWVVTERAQNVSGDEAVRVANAPVWGLAKVIALEHPDLRCTRIDLDSEADADRLRDEIAYGGDEDQVAFRHGERFVARLARDFATGAPVVLRDDATYLVTGGLRGLGLLTAEWLAERGARHIVLAGRSKPSEAAEERIAELRKRGTEVRVSQMDVAARDQMERLLEEVAHSMPVLRGVIHAAGALDDGILAQQSWQRFETVFAAKVDGAWNLHLLTRELSLDFFVLFSSMASLLRSATPSQRFSCWRTAGERKGCPPSASTGARGIAWGWRRSITYWTASAGGAWVPCSRKMGWRCWGNCSDTAARRLRYYRWTGASSRALTPLYSWKISGRERLH